MESFYDDLVMLAVFYVHLISGISFNACLLVELHMVNNDVVRLLLSVS